jgi:hypothetical protein
MENHCLLGPRNQVHPWVSLGLVPAYGAHIGKWHNNVLSSDGSGSLIPISSAQDTTLRVPHVPKSWQGG